VSDDGATEPRRGRSRRRGGPRGSGRAARPLDSDLPLEALDGALGPVRRALAFALRSGRVLPHLAGAILPHLRRATALELPEPIHADVAALAAAAEGLAPGDGSDRIALEALFSELTRLDAVLGLPAPRKLPTPNKRRYERQVEPAPPRGAKPARSASKAARAEVEAPVPVEPPAPSWSGDPRALVDEVLPGAGLPTLSIGELVSLPTTGHEPVDGVHGAGRDLPQEGLVAVGGRVRSHTTLCHADGTRTERLLLMGAGPLWCSWPSGRMPHASLLPHDGRVVLVGRRDGDELVDAEVVVDGTAARPRYQNVEGADDPPLDELRVREALVRLAPLLPRLRDPVATDTLAQLGLLGRGAALGAAQDARPESQEAARQRMAFDEALLVALGTAGRSGRAERGLPHHVTLSGVATLQRFDVDLTDQQQLVFEDIKRDLRRSTPMRRVLTGEVGSGKGTVALLAMAVVAEGKGQVLVIGPDASESDHRFLHTEPLLRELGLVARRVADEPSTSMIDAIRRGEVHVVFGTAALLDAEIPFRRLGLVLSVERFPFGRGAQASLPVPRPDLLVVTQVPVGASVLTAAYGDFEVSVVRDAQRRPATIEVVQASGRGRAYEVLRDAVARGQQGTVLFPRVRGTDALAFSDARRVVQALEASELQECRVALLHGQQSVEEQRRIFDDFRHRRVDVLVTTLALEDGPSIPGLVATVVEQADHVEQWRLHRVIGFLSTSPMASVAVLVVGEHASSDAEARIQRVLDARDGYALTEARVQVRGLAACVVEGGPPAPTFEAVSWNDDMSLVLAARAEAHRLLRADPNLRRGSHQELARELRERWSELWPDADASWTCPFTGDGSGTDRKRRRRRRRRR